MVDLEELVVIATQKPLARDRFPLNGMMKTIN